MFASSLMKVMIRLIPMAILGIALAHTNPPTFVNQWVEMYRIWAWDTSSIQIMNVYECNGTNIFMR